MRGVFICGTDTGVGKTIITGCLARLLKQQGHNVITQKWIETGCRGNVSLDLLSHLRIMGKKITRIEKYIPDMSPYVFKRAFSPHLASRIERKAVKAEKIIQSFRLLSRKFDFVIVEGTGGALVPFNKRQLVIDIAKALDLPVVVVAANRVGAINHTLLTIEALRKRNMPIAGIIFNNLKKENKEALKDNPQIISAIGKVKNFGCLPWVRQPQRLYRNFSRMGKLIAKELV